MTPRVSVVVPAYNDEEHLAETLRSVQEQTLPDWELLLADDGSTDQTVALARQVAAADKRIRVLSFEHRGHPGATRNAAIAQARGDYIAFLDADDLWLPEKLEKQLAAIAGLERPGLVYTLVEEFWDQPDPPPQNWLREPPPATHREQYAMNLTFRQIPCTVTILAERTFVQEIGGFSEDPELRSGQDWDFTNRAIWRRPLVCVPEVLARVRIRARSLSRGNRRHPKYRIYGLELAEKRGELPLDLRRRAWSTAWLIQGERLLAAGEPGWRRALWLAWRHDPLSIYRLPAGLASGLPRGAAYPLYSALKEIQRRVTKRKFA